MNVKKIAEQHNSSEIIDDIIKNDIGITHANFRNRDRLDFHEIHINVLRLALEKAYKAGVGKLI